MEVLTAILVWLINLIPYSKHFGSAILCVLTTTSSSVHLPDISLTEGSFTIAAKLCNMVAGVGVGRVG